MCVTILHVLSCTQIYEQQAKQVRDQEQDYWKDVTPDTMSDEEKQRDVFIQINNFYKIKLQQQSPTISHGPVMSLDNLLKGQCVSNG